MSYTNYNHSFRRQRLMEPSQLYAESNLFNPTSGQKHMLGLIYELDDGRMFRYCKNSSAAVITRARMAAGEAPPSQLEEIAQTAQATAANSIIFDVLVATGNSVSDGDLVDGYLWVSSSDSDGSTIGDSYIIKSNTWSTEDTILTLEIADEGGIRQAISATDDIGIVKNRFRDVVVKPASLASAVVGIPLVDVPISYHFWAQFRGVAPVLIDADATVVIGEPIGAEDTSPAEGSGGVVGDDGTDAVWGTCVSAGVAGEISLIDLLLP